MASYEEKEKMEDDTTTTTKTTTSTTSFHSHHSQEVSESRNGSRTQCSANACMQKFRLYETRSNFYMIGRDKSRTYWRVLKIDRLDPSELNIREDSTTYTESECSDLLRRIHEGNISTGGLKFVTTCYGIVGFIKFLGPYYMLLITKRREIGAICGHTVYAISKSEMIPLPNSIVRSTIPNQRDENRYKKLLCTLDLTKDFFFSYSYHVMCSLQKNLCNNEAGHVLYDTMFVWNEFLTREIRNHLRNTLWTVALVHGFFTQATLSVAGRDFTLTLIARRSRHYAGLRYLRRGVNEKGSVANDVETEQIVFQDVPEGVPMQITSVVQNRGSIPLFWSQETSRLNLKPDIILSKRDQSYEATRLHFENLVKRYENPIIILNLIKTEEKKPRESILRAEFANAIDFINKSLPEENRLRFLHWDLHKHSRRQATNALILLGKVATYALTLTGFFYFQVSPALVSDGCVQQPSLENGEIDNLLSFTLGENGGNVGDYSDREITEENNEGNGVHVVKPPMFQKGVLRTNCIDCLDRTNVAQYAYGLAAIAHQLHTLGVIEFPKIDLNSPLADDLMGFYERMGDTLAHQYGGSAAHNKIFSERRGQWKAATQSQEFFRTLQRYYNNAYMDAMKQDAIDVFLGNFQPEEGKPAIWELDSEQDYGSLRNGKRHIDEDERSFMKRCLSDGNFLRRMDTTMSDVNIGQEKFSGSHFPDHQERDALSESSPDISTSESEITYTRYTPSIPRRQLFGDATSNHIYYSEYGEQSNCSNFVDLDWLSSSGNSCEEDPYERSSMLTNSPVTGLSSENVVYGIGTTPSTNEYGSNMKEREQSAPELSSYRNVHNTKAAEEFSDSFAQWVNCGEALCH